MKEGSTMKKFIFCEVSDRRIAAFSEDNKIPQNASVVFKTNTDTEAIDWLLKNFPWYTEYQAKAMVKGIKENPFNDWIQY